MKYDNMGLYLNFFHKGEETNETNSMRWQLFIFQGAKKR